MNGLRKGKILVVGSTNTDMVVRTEHLPRPGETVLGGTFLMNPGGKGANQAVAAARLGADVIFVCKTGNDMFGITTRQQLAQEGIDTRFVFIDDHNPSGVALISVDSRAENTIVVASGANANLLPLDVAKAETALDDCDIVLMQLETPMTTIEYVAAEAAKRGKRTVLNPAPGAALSPQLLKSLYLITPNETEAEIITGIRIHNAETEAEAAPYPGDGRAERDYHARFARSVHLQRPVRRSGSGAESAGGRYDGSRGRIQRGAGRRAVRRQKP